MSSGLRPRGAGSSARRMPQIIPSEREKPVRPIGHTGLTIFFTRRGGRSHDDQALGGSAFCPDLTPSMIFIAEEIIPVMSPRFPGTMSVLFVRANSLKAST